MNLAHAIDKATTSMNGFRATSVVRRWVLALLLAFPLVAMAAEQKTFATPEQAVDALMAALKADDEAELLEIFGEQHKSLIVTSDRAANSATRAELLAHMQDFRDLEEAGSDRRVLLIGNQGPKWTRFFSFACGLPVQAILFARRAAKLLRILEHRLAVAIM